MSGTSIHSNFGWYHGRTDRAACEALLASRPVGNFLVRDSGSRSGDFVISIRTSDPQAKNGVIHCIVLFDGSNYIAGDHKFGSVQQVIEYFKTHTLNKELLTDFVRAPMALDQTGPAKPILPMRNRRASSPSTPRRTGSKSSSHGSDHVFTPPKMISSPDKWRNRGSRTSSGEWRTRGSRASSGEVQTRGSRSLSNSHDIPLLDTGRSTASSKLGGSPIKEIKAVAINDRSPNAYDSSALAFEVGDHILVLEENANGMWKGSCNDVVGYFPNTSIALVDSY